MIKISLNGVFHSLTTALTLAQLLEQQKVLQKRIAVEVNEQIVPRSQYGQILVKEGDSIEVVQAIGGG